MAIFTAGLLEESFLEYDLDDLLSVGSIDVFLGCEILREELSFVVV